MLFAVVAQGYIEDDSENSHNVPAIRPKFADALEAARKSAESDMASFVEEAEEDGQEIVASIEPRHSAKRNDAGELEQYQCGWVFLLGEGRSQHWQGIYEVVEVENLVDTSLSQKRPNHPHDISGYPQLTSPIVDFEYNGQFDYGGRVNFPEEWTLDQCLQWVKNSTDKDWESLWKFDGLSLDTEKGDRFCADKTGRLGYRECLSELLVDEPTRRKFDIEGSLC